jgi:hypothetical protein
MAKRNVSGIVDVMGNNKVVFIYMDASQFLCTKSAYRFFYCN